MVRVRSMRAHMCPCARRTTVGCATVGCTGRGACGGGGGAAPRTHRAVAGRDVLQDLADVVVTQQGLAVWGRVHKARQPDVGLALQHFPHVRGGGGAAAGRTHRGAGFAAARYADQAAGEHLRGPAATGSMQPHSVAQTHPYNGTRTGAAGQANPHAAVGPHHPLAKTEAGTGRAGRGRRMGVGNSPGSRGSASGTQLPARPPRPTRSRLPRPAASPLPQAPAPATHDPCP